MSEAKDVRAAWIQRLSDRYLIGAKTAKENAIRLAVCRIVVVGAMLWWNNVHFLTKWNASELYTKWSPILPFSLILDGPMRPENLWAAHLFWRVVGVAFGLGLFASLTGPLLFLSSIVVMAYDYNFGEVNHSNQLVVLCIGVLAFSRSADVLSFDAWLRKAKRNGGASMPSWVYRWSVVLGGLMFSLVYTSAGISKLAHGDGLRWAWSENLAVRMSDALADRGFSNWLLDQPPIVVRCFALAALLWQLSTILMVVTKRQWWMWLTAAGAFHLGVTFVFGGHGPFFVHLACFLFFVPVERVFVARNAI